MKNTTQKAVTFHWENQFSCKAKKKEIIKANVYDTLKFLSFSVLAYIVIIELINK